MSPCFAGCTTTEHQSPHARETNIERYEHRVCELVVNPPFIFFWRLRFSIRFFIRRVYSIILPRPFRRRVRSAYDEWLSSHERTRNDTATDSRHAADTCKTRIVFRLILTDKLIIIASYYQKKKPIPAPSSCRIETRFECVYRLLIHSPVYVIFWFLFRVLYSFVLSVYPCCFHYANSLADTLFREVKSGRTFNTGPLPRRVKYFQSMGYARRGSREHVLCVGRYF